MSWVEKEIEVLLYNLPNSDMQVEAIVKDETLRLTQKSMARLFEIDQSWIARHMKNIFDTWELEKNSVYAIFAYTGSDGKTYDVQFYNLDAIISVWYRVNSAKATKFRIRATKVLREYIIKWFALDDERLKNWNNLWRDYFEELLERVHSIRSSERRIRQQITDLFAECSVDYEKDSEITKEFYATIQNKFLQLHEKLLLRLCMKKQTKISLLCEWLLEKMLQNEEFWNQIQLLQKIIFQKKK